MNTTMRTTSLCLIGSLLMASALAPRSAGAQTPEQQRQMEYERQQREYWRQQEQQRQEQQRQQQIMNENARRQQEESRRYMEATTPKSQTPSYQSSPPQAGPQPQGAQGDALEEARRTWQKRPSLPADRNPLLGKWTRPPSGRGNSSDPFAAIAALAKGGLCEVLFGDGVFEFRPNTLVGIDRRMHEQELDQVEYRGDARRVAVVPKSTLKLMVFDVEGPNRINWAAQKCVLVRVGAASAGAATAPPSARTAAASPTPTPAAPGVDKNNGAVLNLAAGFASGSGAFSPLAGTKFIVLKSSVDAALAKGGYRPPLGMSAFKGWAIACQQGTPACAQGLNGVQADSLGVLQTDAQGKAHTPPLAAGTYYLFGSTQHGKQPVMWNVRVDLKPGANAVTLDQSNAAPIK